MYSETITRPITDLDLKKNFECLNELYQNPLVDKEVLDTTEIVMSDENYIYVITRYERETTQSNIVVDYPYSLGIPEGYHIYKISMNDEDKKYLIQQNHSTAWFTCNALTSTLKEKEKLQTIPDKTGRSAVPSVYLLNEDNLEGYPYKYVLWEELLHVEDMKLLPWSRIQEKENCLTDEGFEVILQCLITQFNLDREELLKYSEILRSRELIGEVYPYLVMAMYIGKNGFSPNNSAKAEIIKDMLKNKETIADMSIHGLRTLVGDALIISWFSQDSLNIKELKQKFRKLYKDVDGV